MSESCNATGGYHGYFEVYLSIGYEELIRNFHDLSETRNYSQYF